MKKTMLLILTTAVVAVSGGILLAQAASKPAPGQRLARVGKFLNLSDEQKVQVKGILVQAKADAAKAATPAEKRQVWLAARATIRDKVLTADQRQKAQLMLRRIGLRHAFAQLGLTAEQKTQARDIFKQARLDAKQAPDKAAKQAIWKVAFEKVKTQVLTDPQRKQLEEMKARRQAKTPTTVS